MTTSPRLATILKLHDAGHSAQQIATAQHVTPGYVYGVLREHRPNRPRKARTRTSDLPRMIRGLRARGIQPRRIAFLQRCSPAYVYRVLSETEAGP